MSELLTINQSWPATLPLPFIDFEGYPTPSTLTGTLREGNILRRRRFTSSYVGVQVRWHFDANQFQTFESFFSVTLHCGVSQFLLTLRYPQNTELTSWAVRFVEGYESLPFDDSRWEVRAPLLLVQTAILSDWVSIIPHAILDDEGLPILDDDGNYIFEDF